MELVEQTTNKLLTSAPVSIEMPAGTGKTHLLASTVQAGAKNGCRSLILTHTNAGVTAIRQRLTQFSVPTKLYSVNTIASWAFTLASSYQDIAGVQIPSAPDWSQSGKYLQGAIAVAKAPSIQEVLQASYDYLLVDEYQDCSQLQHKFILSLQNSIPKTIVFGDRLQSIFGFKDNVLVDWENDVMAAFPPHSIALFPHRWANTNPVLGQFTLDIRPHLYSGNTINLGNHRQRGVHWVQVKGEPNKILSSVCRSLSQTDETIAVLTDWPKNEDKIARSLGGRFSVVEPISGSRMATCLRSLPKEGDPHLAYWLAVTAKKFHTGLGEIDQSLLSILNQRKSIAGRKRKHVQSFIDALSLLQKDPTYQTLLEVKSVPSQMKLVRCTHREAWRDIFGAIEYSFEGNSQNMVTNLATVRSKAKYIDRRLPRSIISRTLIVKGLEFDHVVLADLEKFSDPRHLYVALSRATKSVTILGKSSSIRLQRQSK